jgi:hypothetical protein
MFINIVESITDTTEDGISSVMIAAQQNNYGEACDAIILGYGLPDSRKVSSNQVHARVHADRKKGNQSKITVGFIIDSQQ